MTSASRLALDGGSPVRDVRAKPWPAWPIFGVEEERALLDVLHSGQWWYVGGDRGVRIEQEFAAFQHARFGVACTNGTAALEIALRALGIGPGDEVIVPPYTFVATATAVLSVGATPIFADIDGDTLNMDPGRAEAAVTERTRALIAVHVAGRPADMDAILAIARRHDLRVIEDAAQAHGAEWRGRRVGALGDIGTFSFQASKNLNAGEGGMVVTNDEALAAAAWSVMNVGRPRGGRWYEHAVLGSNYRMTEFQAAVLLEQLRRLPEQTATRAANATRLRRLLAGAPGINMPVEDERITCHANHLFPVRVDDAAFCGRGYQAIIAALNAEGISCSSGYVPLYQEALFTTPVSRRAAAVRKPPIDYSAQRLPVCEAVCCDTIWLPQHLLLAQPEDMEDVAEAFAKVRDGGRG